MDEATRCTDERDHDWRVDPFAALLSNPPAERLVCARCNATTTRHRATTPAQPGRPQTWPKA